MKSPSQNFEKPIRKKSTATKLLDEYKVHIEIGTAYNVPLQSGDELVRVTAMVSAFNKERGNLGNIQIPLDIIYDCSISI